MSQKAALIYLEQQNNVKYATSTSVMCGWDWGGEKSLNSNVKVIVCPLAVSFGLGHN